MPNGYHGSAEEWRRLVAPLVAVDEEIETFARDHGMALERDSHSWPSRQLRWFANLDRSIEIYLNADKKSYRVGISCSEDRIEGRYWRSEIIADVGVTDLPAEVLALMSRAMERVARWTADDLAYAGPIPPEVSQGHPEILHMKSRFSRLVVRSSANIFGGPQQGTKYDLSTACPRCGSGATQVGPLLVGTTKFPKNEIFMTLDREILVVGALASSLADAGFARLLGEVVFAKSGERLPVLQLIPEDVLPRFSPMSSGIVRERPCPACDRDGYFGVPHQPTLLRYEGVKPSLLERDLVATYERFGNSRLREPFHESVFAAPLYVASDRFTRVLEAERVKGVELEPVMGNYPPL